MTSTNKDKQIENVDRYKEDNTPIFM